MAVRLSAWRNTIGTGRIFVEFYILVFTNIYLADLSGRAV